MTDPAAATRSMIENLPAKTGRSLSQWFGVLDASGLVKHGELMNLLKNDYGVSHGFANGIVLQYRGRDTVVDDPVAQQYSGAKGVLRPIYDTLVAAASDFGADVEVAPKKASVSLRRSKQFALIEAPSAKRVVVGIQLPGEPAVGRLEAAGGMCSHRIVVTSPEEVDPELVGWLRAAYDRA